MEYTKEELELLDTIENGNLERIPFDNNNIKQMAKRTREYNQEKKQISINLKKTDLDVIKQKAEEIGISYQNIIQALVHNYATNKLSLKI